MRIIVQRVSSASVSVNEQVVGRCGPGFCLLVGIHANDTEATVGKAASKVAGLRIMSDEAGKMNLSLDQCSAIGAQILAISNFTVYGDVSKNRRPSFTESAGFEAARTLFDRFVANLRALGLGVETGEFGADMQVSIVNDGPVTLVVEISE
jgi:D-aminoacyl-tRNA deacylase